MAIEFTYRFTSSTVPYDDLTVEPDPDSAISVGQQLLAEGNHTVSEPKIIDEYTKEWTLTFPDSDAWITYKDAVLSLNYDTASKEITTYPVKTPD